MIKVKKDSNKKNKVLTKNTSPLFINITSPEQKIPNFQQINIFISYIKEVSILGAINIKPKKIKKNTKKKTTKKKSIIKKQILLNRILNQRKQSAVYLSSFFKSKLIKINLIKENLIMNLMSYRCEEAIKLQSFYRMRKVRKHFVEMLFKSSFVFYYSLNSKILLNIIDKFNFFDSFEVFVNIYENSNKNKNKNINQIKCKIKMKYCPYLNLYYFCIGTQKRILRPVYKVKFSYNDKLITDTRYPIELNENGGSFNLITKEMFLSRIKKSNYFIYKNKDECQKKLKRSNSDDSIVSNPSIIMEQIANGDTINYCFAKIQNNTSNKNNCKNIKTKSILKAGNKKDKKCDSFDGIKKVSFNKIIIMDSLNYKTCQNY